jgi:serine/threonine-protein kinase RsbW
MEATFMLQLPREEASVPVVRQLCRSSLETLGIAEDCVADLELVVTEACTNVLKHARGAANRYEVEIDVVDSTCEVRIRDAGGRFLPDAAVMGEPSTTTEGGRGLHLMRVLVDRLQFISDESGTVVHLTKSLTLQDDSPLGNGAPPRRSYTGAGAGTERGSSGAPG